MWILSLLIAALAASIEALEARGACSHDNCLRALIRHNGAAFCSDFLATPTLPTPTYASQCAGSLPRVRSACHCLGTSSSLSTTSSTKVTATSVSTSSLTSTSGASLSSSSRTSSSKTSSEFTTSQTTSSESSVSTTTAGTSSLISSSTDSSQSSTSTAYTITGASTAYLATPVSCYTLPTPTDLLVNVSISVPDPDDPTVYYDLDVFMGPDLATMQYIEVFDNTTATSVLFDITQLMNDQLGIVFPDDDLQVLLNTSGIFMFNSSCSGEDAIYIPNFFTQLGEGENDANSSPPAKRDMKQYSSPTPAKKHVKRHPAHESDGLTLRQITSFQAVLTIQSDCGTMSVKSFSGQIQYDGDTCPSASCPDCMSNDFEVEAAYTCPIPDPTSLDSKCEASVAQTWAWLQQHPNVLQVLNRLPLNLLSKLFPGYAAAFSVISKGQKITKFLLKNVSPSQMAGLVCLAVRNNGANTLSVLLSYGGGSETNNPLPLATSLGTPLGFSAELFVYQEQTDEYKIRCSCSTLSGFEAYCTTTAFCQNKCGPETICPAGTECLYSACCGENLCLVPSTCNTY